MFVFATLRSWNVYGKVCKLVACRKSCSTDCFEILDYVLKEAIHINWESPVISQSRQVNTYALGVVIIYAFFFK